MYRYDADELETMATSIVAAIRKYAIPVKQLTDKQIWEGLQKNGYRFPVSGHRFPTSAKWGEDIRYSTIGEETDWWFEALHLALKQVRESGSH